MTRNTFASSSRMGTTRLHNPSQIQSQRCQLICLEGPRKGEVIDIDPDDEAEHEVLVGSSSDCHIQIADDTLSRRHFALLPDGLGFALRDLDSTNGTFVDDMRVKEVYLRAGSTVRAGTSLFRFETAYQPVELQPSDRDEMHGLLGTSRPMRELFAAIEKVAPTEATVLIHGQTGTGKGALARAIHATSQRAGGPLIVFDCGATVPNLVESELFGHERGAFTGAVKQRRGALEEARGGTIFIDELAELSLDLQPKLLRALEEREFTPVGGTKPVKLDCRVIAASQVDLWGQVLENQFRRDLYFRLAVVTMPLPALKSRIDDIPLLVNHFLNESKGPHPASFAALSATLQKHLLDHHWPGNIRELRNVIERICVLDNPEWEQLVQERELRSSITGASPEVDVSLPFKEAKDAVVNAFEREYLAKLLERTGNNVAQAARTAQVNRRHLYTLLAKHGLIDGPA